MRRTLIAVAVSIALVVGVVAGQSGAASSGRDGGNTVTVGASSDGSTGGVAGSPGSGSGPNPVGTGGAGGAGAVTCQDLALTLSDIAFPPGGPTPGGWYSVTCTNRLTGAVLTQTEWISTATPSAPASAPIPTVDPRVLALQAEQSIRLPAPVPAANPPDPAIVNLPTWLWIDAGLWHPYSATANAGAVVATALATPLSVTWSMGDGHIVVCDGPGTPYGGGAPSGASSACSYTYRTTSAGQPPLGGNSNDGAFTVTSTVTWAVTWSSVGAPGGGALPDLTTTGSLGLPVAQIQSVNQDRALRAGGSASSTAGDR